MNNFIKTREWLKLGFDEFDAALRSLDDEDYNHAVYQIQQCLEKSVKAVVCFLGIEIKKTHYPAKEIIKIGIIENQQEINRLKLSDQQLAFLKEIAEFSLPLEE